jgi:hypothetical protein
MDINSLGQRLLQTIKTVQVLIEQAETSDDREVMFGPLTGVRVVGNTPCKRRCHGWPETRREQRMESPGEDMTPNSPSVLPSMMVARPDSPPPDDGNRETAPGRCRTEPGAECRPESLNSELPSTWTLAHSAGIDR